MDLNINKSKLTVYKTVELKTIFSTHMKNFNTQMNIKTLTLSRPSFSRSKHEIQI